MFTVVFDCNVSKKELRTVSGGKAMATFRASQKQSKKDRDGEWKTAWLNFNCVAFEPQSTHIADYVTDGDKVLVWGDLVAETFIGSDGEKREAQKVIVRQITRLGDGWNKKSEGSKSEPKSEPKRSKKEENEDDFPF